MSLLFLLYQNDAMIQIVIATEECKQDTYALLIYNSTVESNDEVHIGFSSGIYTIQTITFPQALAEIMQYLIRITLLKTPTLVYLGFMHIASTKRRL